MNLKNSFPRKNRLNNSIIIREVFKKGIYKSLGPIGVKFRKTEFESSLFAISVKKKVGSSPFRNRIKRLLREAIRIEKSSLVCSFEICFFLIYTPKDRVEYQNVLNKVNNFFEYLNRKFCSENEKN